MKNTGDRQTSRLLIFILCVVVINIVLTMYWLIMDKNNLKNSNLQELESKRQTDDSEQIQPYLESPNVLTFTPNPVTMDERGGTDKPHLPWYFKGGTMRPTRARVFPRSRTTSSRIWPEEFAGSDRVEEQLMFVPPYYEYDYAFMKKILLYNDFDGWNVDVGQNEFLLKDCPVNRCLITTKKSEGPIADAIVFRNSYSRPSHQKTHNQVWIMAVVESAYNKRLGVDQHCNAINWTATYRHDSDIVLPYGRWAYYNPKVTEIDQLGRNYALDKTKQVAMFVSKCDTDNGRLQYAETLGKYIPVDVYGACGGVQSETVESDDFLTVLDRDYKFYLAFESSNCKDYVTDKFFVNGLQHDALPIVMGGRREDYERAAPKWSYVYAGDFESPELLAEYLRRLDADDALYNEYFRWRGSGEFIDTRFFCRLCAMLHDDGGVPVKHYADLDAWWNGPGVCDRPAAPLPPPPPQTVVLQQTTSEGRDRDETYEDNDDDNEADSSRTERPSAEPQRRNET